ncbi:hypothetical protein [Yinghuangia soli]|uniref:Uncharacterized protein n=1 Tax=Yinghuangia soli TaxID=2908204 RepID=A0AA41U1G7_9ACTN|nr:hypothetical protein [Yinghuangia soli]MCF2529606.1 hypothetical protein [Yinghuangia soli]
MRTTRGRAAFAAATALATLALAAPALATGARADEADWHTWPLGAPRDDQELRAVAALGPRDVWAVGYRGEAADGPPLVQHFDGHAWRDIPVEVASGNGQFDAVAPLAADDVWALGHWNEAAASNDRALAVHFDGHTWRQTPMPPEPRNMSAYPFGAAAIGPSDVWAVGALAEDRIADPHPLAYHWDGTSWTSVTTPDTGGNAILFAAAADGAGGAWAVGVAYTGGVGRPLVEHWDGTRWRIVDVPFDTAQAHSLEGVAVLGPDDAWAVGSSSGADGVSHPTAYHWDGTAWTPAAMPPVEANLHGVSADPVSGVVWAAGTRPDEKTPAVLMRWDGTAWVQVPAAEDPDARGASLFSVAAVPGADPALPSAWAVGSTLPTFQEPWHAVIEGYGPPPGRQIDDRGPQIGPQP